MTISKEDATISRSSNEELADFGYTSIVDIALKEYGSMQPADYAQFGKVFFPTLMNRFGEPAQYRISPEAKEKLFDMVENIIPAIDDLDILGQIIEMRSIEANRPIYKESADRLEVIDRIGRYARVAMGCKKAGN